jgi:hypothetical protein
MGAVRYDAVYPDCYKGTFNLWGIDTLYGK